MYITNHTPCLHEEQPTYICHRYSKEVYHAIQQGSQQKALVCVAVMQQTTDSPPTYTCTSVGPSVAPQVVPPAITSPLAESVFRVKDSYLRLHVEILISEFTFEI